MDWTKNGPKDWTNFKFFVLCIRWYKNKITGQENLFFQIPKLTLTFFSTDDISLSPQALLVGFFLSSQALLIEFFLSQARQALLVSSVDLSLSLYFISWINLGFELSQIRVCFELGFMLNLSQM